MSLHASCRLLDAPKSRGIVVTVLLMLLPLGVCCNARQVFRLEGSEKTAWMMYKDNATFDTLNNRGNEYLQSIGREAFLSDMVVLAGTKYAEESIYCIGLIGDRRHVALVASKLDNNSEKTQNVAVAALSRLTGESLSDVSSAKTWWETHKHSYPPIEQGRQR